MKQNQSNQKIPIFSAAFFILTSAITLAVMMNPESIASYGINAKASSLKADIIVMNSLTRHLKQWDQLSDFDKKTAVKLAIERFRVNQNTAILNPPEFYLKKVDSLLKSGMVNINSTILPILIKTIAELENDFYNGLVKK